MNEIEWYDVLKIKGVIYQGWVVKVGVSENEKEVTLGDEMKMGNEVFETWNGFGLVMRNEVFDTE